MIPIQIGELERTENHLYTICDGKDKFNIDESSFHLDLTIQEKLVIFTLNEDSAVTFIDKIDNYSEILQSNLLALSDWQILKIIAFKNTLFIKFILSFFSNEIKEIIEDSTSSKELLKTLSTIKLRSTYSQYYKPGEDFIKTEHIGTFSINDPYLYQLAQDFNYDKNISVSYDGYGRPEGYDLDMIEKYRKNLKRIEQELCEFILSKYDSTEHQQILLNNFKETLSHYLRGIDRTDHSILSKVSHSFGYNVNNDLSIKNIIWEYVKISLLTTRSKNISFLFQD